MRHLCWMIVEIPSEKEMRDEHERTADGAPSPVTARVEQHDRIEVDTELLEGDRLEQFFQRAAAAR